MISKSLVTQLEENTMCFRGTTNRYKKTKASIYADKLVSD